MAKTKSKSSKTVGAPKLKEKGKPLPNPESKIDLVIRLLQRKQGASVDALRAATKWEPHTVRSILSRTMRQKGFKVTSAKPSDRYPRIYRIEKSTVAQ